MTPDEAIAELEARQIIHGGTIFGDIAKTLREAKSIIAETQRHALRISMPLWKDADKWTRGK